MRETIFQPTTPYVGERIKQNDATKTLGPSTVSKQKKKQPKHHCVGVHFPLHNQVGVGVFIKEMTDHNISLIGLNRNATTILQITP